MLRGFDPPLIPRDRLTVPQLLKAHGYDTAMFGKWHPGLTFATTDGKAPSHRARPTNIAWDKPLTDSPLDHGFDVFFGTAASMDMPPYGWIEGRRFTAPCDERVSLTDLLATCAELVGAPLPDDAGEDSISNLPLLLGRPYPKPLHPVIIHQASNGSLGITKGKWKLELCKGNGGWVCPYDGKDPKTLPDVQLYDVATAPGESTDLHETHPDIVAALRAELAHCQESGSTRR